MNVREAIPILKAQKVFKKTRCGRSITEDAIAVIDASLADEKNYDAEVISCLNCCIILSSLLIPGGCPNCGSKDFTTDVIKEEIL